MITSGETTAISRAFCSIQLSPSGSGLPKRSLIAFAVAKTGFHIAIVPSQSGMSEGGVKTDDTMPNGNAIAKRLPAASWFLTLRPIQTPTQISENRSRSRDDQTKVLLIMTIEHYVTGTVRTYLLQKQAEEESGISDEKFWAQHPMLAAAMESGRYPHMAALDMTAFDIGPDLALEFGLQPLLDGLESAAGRPRTAAG